MTLLEMGMPIALWSRMQMESKGTFEGLLTYETLPILPQVIWGKRRDAINEQGHVDYHLSLLWDDPFRLPPSTTAQPLASPARKG